MNRLNAKTIMALGFIALGLSGAGTAYGQYVTTGTGTAPAGGNIVVGSGTSLGRIASNLPGTLLTAGGGDTLTLNIGSIASTNQHGATVKFGTPNDTLINNGTIFGGTRGDNTDSGVGVSFLSSDLDFGDRGSSTGISNETVTNNGAIYGEFQGEDTPDIAGTALSFFATDTIQNVSVTNNGTLLGASSGGDEVSATGLSFYTENSSISKVTLLNTGNIAGGNDSGNDEEAVVGAGVSIYAGNGVSNVQITNTQTGSITGGSDESPGSTFTTGGDGIVVFDDNDSGGQINGVTLKNAGSIAGGSENFEATSVGNGVSIWGGNGVYNVNITNTQTGSIIGGNDNEGFDEDDGESVFFGPVAGNGISIFDLSGGSIPEDINTVFINNAGNIIGGSQNFFGWNLGDGIGIYGFGNVGNITIYNSGLIQGGNFNEDGQLVGDGIAIGAGGFIDNGSVDGVLIVNLPGGTISGGMGDEEGAGISIYSGNGISGVGIYNYGQITGGPGGRFEKGDVVPDSEGNSFGGNGISINAPAISNVTIVNATMNSMISGGSGAAFGGNGGDGIEISDFDPGNFDEDFSEVVSSDPSNISIVNYGMIVGGAGYGSGNNGGTGVYFAAPNDSNITITNWCGINGGNGYNGAAAGIGVQIGDVFNQIVADHVTLNNWGEISAGSGAANFSPLPSGFPPVAISVYGNNNVINLNGHSSVNGTIQNTNVGGNNTLNLNFTGMSPSAIAGLKAQLTAQGWPGSNNFQGIFTVRNVTYYVDPIQLNLNVSSYQLQGLTPNQQAVGASLDSLQVNPNPCSQLMGLFNAIDNGGNVPLALEELSPQMYQIYGDISLATLNFLAQEIDHRLNNLRDGSETIDTTGMGGDTTIGLSKDDNSKDGKNVVTQEAPEKRWGFFASGAGVFGNVDDNGGDLAGARFTTSELILAVDGKINDRFTAGLLFNYDYTTATMDGQGSNANVQTYQGGVYTGYRNGGWYGNGLAVYGHNSYDSTRAIIFPGFSQVATGSTDGNQYEVNVDGGYDFHVNDRLTVGPLAGLQYVHLDVNGFQEFGAGPADLAVGSQDLNSLRSRIGFRADYHKQVRKEVAFAAEVRAAWQHEFLDNSYGISGDFNGLGLAPFTVQTTKAPRDAALVGAGCNFTVRDRVTVFVDYDVLAQPTYLEQTVKGGFKISF